MVIEILILASLGLLVCSILGANNASACFGASVGAGLAKYSILAGVAALGAFLGVLLEGPKLSKAISGGILTLEIDANLLWTIMITIFIVITIATIFHLPLSLSEALIGSAIGIGLERQMSLNLGFTLTIFISWLINPFFAAILSAIIHKIMTHYIYKIKNLLTLNYIYVTFSLSLSFYVAYVLGANTVGLINGLYASFISKAWIGAVMFGAATAMGIFFLSRGITKSVGKEIIGISPLSALVAQMSGALTIHFFTQLGIPVSVTQALIGGIFGIGLAKTMVLVNKRMIQGIIMGWALAPLSGLVISYLILKVI